ncbi:CD209 antigen-like protein E isoform X2 [Boleophthalmus pectinirostris]|uniref:CD209 antigen-like protein E isoform X2 n=1 Tax=Boleophthalmus pectinirostris TaxID=150288 RepID=UPI0024308EBC|nr:CD209 antigen-like protein E isoform X2 [Boleophthalmus pectinirostris]
MAVYFHSSTSEISVEMGEYQEMDLTEPRSTSKPKCKHLSGVVLSFGILCILQATLNISLRLILTEKAELTAGESFTTRAPAPITNTTKDMSRLCPLGWRRYGSKCYFLSTQRADFDQSRKNCEVMGAQLVKLNNRREQGFLTGLTEAAWIGMTDRNREGIWLWLDGTPVNRNELQWAPGQPDDSNGGEDCGDIRNQNNFVGLNDAKCSFLMQWICEKPLNGM